MAYVLYVKIKERRVQGIANQNRILSISNKMNIVLFYDHDIKLLYLMLYMILHYLNF